MRPAEDVARVRELATHVSKDVLELCCRSCRRLGVECTFSGRRGLINFAPGDVFMLGGMISVTLASAFGIKAGMGGLWLLVILVMLLAMVCCGILNGTIEAIAYRPLRGAPRLAPLITAIGVS